MSEQQKIDLIKSKRKVELRFVGKFMPKVHWLPEIYMGFGRDY